MSTSSALHKGTLMATANEAIYRLHRSLDLADSDFFCECGHNGCKERITLSRGEYAGLLQESRPLLAAAHADRERAADTELQTLRGQIHQLQETLASRLNIEQAKGVLVERHGMTSDDAFEALRQRARDQRRSLDEVCAQIIAWAGIPEPSDPSPRRAPHHDQAGKAMDVDHEPMKVRIAKNEALFRATNETIELEAESVGVGADPVPFVCECPDPSCTEIVELTLIEYEEVRTGPTRFFVLPGHEALAVQANAAAVVEEHGRVVIADKIGIAGQVAAALHGKGSVAEIESDGHGGH